MQQTTGRAALKEDLARAIRGEVLDDAETLAEHSTDASLFSVRPELVVYPRDGADISAVVRFVNERKERNPHLSVTARAAGSCMSGGSLNDSIILDVSRYLVGIPALGADAVTVLPGTPYRDLEKRTLERGLIMPAYTASKNLCAIGGMIGNNAGGEKTLAYGKIERYIRSLRMVFADGVERVIRSLSKPELDEVLARQDFEGMVYRGIFKLVTEHQELLAKAKPKVSKNSAGYYLWNVWDGTTFDLTKLIVGSQGTLGIVTEATLGLVPVPKVSGMLVVFLKELAPVPGLVNDLLPFAPQSIESYDDHTLQLAFKYFPELFRLLKNRNFLKVAKSFLPEALILARTGMPKLVMLAEFAAGSEEELHATLRTADLAARKYGFPTRIVHSAEEADEYWAVRRESYNLLRKHAAGKRAAPFIDDIIVPPAALPDFMPRLTRILEKYRLLYTVAGHAGDGNFHIIPLVDMREPGIADTLVAAMDEVNDLTLSFGGSITAEHNDGILRTPYLEKMYGPEVMRLFEQTKQIFDPKNIFNPGKKVGGSIAYLKEHMVRDGTVQKTV
jgi:FAD/FMN-containing dehydrogenase